MLETGPPAGVDNLLRLSCFDASLVLTGAPGCLEAIEDGFETGLVPLSLTWYGSKGWLVVATPDACWLLLASPRKAIDPKPSLT